MTPDEYLRRERMAEFRSEYLRGEVFAMDGASFNHNLIVGDLDAIDCQLAAADVYDKVDFPK